jgi:hypothetical protein
MKLAEDFYCEAINKKARFIKTTDQRQCIGTRR